MAGAIDVSASKNSLKVSIDNCEFINNTATDTAGAAIGGAIRIGGRASGDNMVVSVENSNFINNAAADGGSAIYNDGTLALSKNTVDAGAEINELGEIIVPTPTPTPSPTPTPTPMPSDDMPETVIQNDTETNTTDEPSASFLFFNISRNNSTGAK
jgi:hypothetical protein